MATVAVVAGSWAALATQVSIAVPSWQQLVLALYEFAIVTAVALWVQKFWTQKLSRVVNLTIAPILILVGIRFLWMAV